MFSVLNLDTISDTVASVIKQIIRTCFFRFLFYALNKTGAVNSRFCHIDLYLVVFVYLQNVIIVPSSIEILTKRDTLTLFCQWIPHAFYFIFSVSANLCRVQLFVCGKYRDSLNYSVWWVRVRETYGIQKDKYHGFDTSLTFDYVISNNMK